MPVPFDGEIQVSDLKKQISEWLQVCRERRNLSENSIRGYQQDLVAFLRFTKSCGKFTATEEEILHFLRHLREVKEHQPATVRRRIVTLRKFMVWLAETGVCDNPFARLDLDLSIPKRLPRPVDRPTLQMLFRDAHPPKVAAADPARLATEARYSKDHITGLALRVLVSTGLRIGELTHLRLVDISGAGSRLRVIGKGNRERTVYVTNELLLQELWTYCQFRLSIDVPDGWLFLNSQGRRLTEAAFRKRLRTTSKSLNLPEHLTPHRFRHTAATLLIEEGVDIRIVQRLLGHASIATTELYTQVSDNSLITAIQRADTLGKVDI